MDYCENLLKAVDIIVDKKLEQNARYDQTVLATIVDSSDNVNGRYIVKSETAQFLAITQANDTNIYTNGSKVYVTIPQGDYTNDKIILGRASSTQDASRLLYRTAIEQVYNLIPSDYMIIGNEDSVYSLDETTPQQKRTIGTLKEKSSQYCSAFLIHLDSRQ